MADEATPQENTTENAVTDAVENAAPVDSTPDIGDSVQATEADTKASDSADADKTPKVYDESYVRNLRAENAATRIKVRDAEHAAQEAAAKATEIENAQKSLIEQVGRAFGFVKDDAPLSPEDLLKQAEEQKQAVAQERDSFAQERDAANERIRNFERRDALTRAVNSVDGDLEAILDSRKVNESIAKLDTNADDFNAQVAEIVSAAVESNPKLKKVVQAAAPRSGGDLSGGNGATKPSGDQSVEDVIRERRAKRDRERS